MTTRIPNIAKFTLLAVATISLGLTCNITTAIAKSTIDRNIEPNLPAKNIIALNKLDDSISAVNKRERSMEYVQKGLAVQQETGDEMEAMQYYYEALKIDITNPAAFMAAGNLLGNTEAGINCVKAAALLFDAEEDREGYELAMSWLAQHGISE
jgi:hypothetical protein